MASAEYANGTNPEGALNFTVPANCDKLWLVVSGSPQEYWVHAWDDNDANDEQWPYQIQLANTNLLGETNPPAVVIPPTTGIAPTTNSDHGFFAVRDGALELAKHVEGAEIRDLRGNLVHVFESVAGSRKVALTALPRGILLVRTKGATSNGFVSSACTNP